jgi:hypothetical protein
MVRQIGCNDLGCQQSELSLLVFGGFHEYLLSEVVVQKMGMICSARKWRSWQRDFYDASLVLNCLDFLR